MAALSDGNGLAPLTASDLGAKALTVVLPDGTRFSMALFPGTSEKAFGTAIATRAKLPLQYHDGTESFFVTVGGPNGLVVPLCADGLPDGQTLTMHVNPAPPPVVRFAAPGGDATQLRRPKHRKQNRRGQGSNERTPSRSSEG